MSKLNNIQQLLFAPADDKGGTATAIEDKALSKGDAIEFLGEDTKEEEIIELDKDNKETKEKGQEDDEDNNDKKEKSLEEELEEDLKEPDEEDLETIVPPPRREILTKYPTLFKDFPYLEKAFYREQRYSEIVPTIEAAQEAVDKASLLDSYEQELTEGSTEGMLRAIKEGDGEAFNRIVDNYLPNLHKVDEGAYYHVIGNIIKHTIKSMVDENSEELTDAARLLNEYIFGSKTYTPPGRLSKVDNAKNPKETELEEKEQKFLQTQFDTHGGALQDKVSNILKSTIDKFIDPRESMTDYVKKNATREAYDTLDGLIERDAAFTKILDRLWERAINDNFSTKSMDSIKSAYLSKARTLLPAVIKKARNEALRGLGKRTADNDDDDRDRKGPLPVSKARTSTSSSSSGKTGNSDREKARAIPKDMKSIDYLMQD